MVDTNETNDGKIRDFDKVLNAEFGEPGTPGRAKSLEEAFALYSGQTLPRSQPERKLE